MHILESQNKLGETFGEHPVLPIPNTEPTKTGCYHRELQKQIDVLSGFTTSIVKRVD